MSKRDYYEILGVARDAGAQEIKKSFRRLASKYHPDRHDGQGRKAAEAKFKEAREAYEVLSDDQRRAMYDRFGHQEDGGGPGSAGGMGGVDLGDIFGGIFGDIFGGSRGGGQSRGADVSCNIQISLKQAASGATIEVDVPVRVSCEICRGTGAKKGSSPTDCRDCEGHGQIRIQQGFFTVQQTCPTCRGAGQVIKDPCVECRGKGRKRKNKKLSVKIPPGVDTGDRIRLGGEGEAGAAGSSPGDLYVEVHVKPHDIFVREGVNLHCEVPLNFVTLALGGEIEVPTLTGRVKLKVPPETQSDKVFRIRGAGILPVRGGSKGDLFCKVIVETPVNLTHKQKELLTQFSKTLSEDNRHHPRSVTWFEKVKRFFEGVG